MLSSGAERDKWKGESLLNLPKLAEILSKAKKQLEEESNSTNDQPNYSSETKPNIEEQLDEISSIAIEDYKKLVDYGFSVEPRIAGDIFSPAAQILKIALEARNIKLEKELKLLKLKIDSEKNLIQTTIESGESLDENNFVADRNKILKLISGDHESSDQQN